jgi:hypothetical protein
MKLPTPVSNSRDAFCPDTTCKQRFYRLRCYVCEEKKPGRLDAHTCGRRKCKNAIRSLKRPDDIGHVEIAIKKPTETTLSDGGKYSRTWKVVTGEISPGALHRAAVRDGPGCQWKDGEYERIEVKNRRALEAHFAKLTKKCFIQPNHMPANIQGGYRPKYRPLKVGREKSLDEIRARVASGIPFNDPDAGQSKLPDPIIPGMGYGGVEKATDKQFSVQLPDNLSIPTFLDRRGRAA